MRRRVRLLAVAVAAALVPGVAALAVPGAASAARPDYRPGSAGIGDPYYPTYGNGGYDVRHYDVRVGYTPSIDRLVGHTTITATATQALSSFHLDLALPASSVTVDGVPARTRQHGRELVVTPRTGVRSGHTMTVAVRYAGVPSRVTRDGLDPWIRTADGAAAVGEPEIAAWWFPSNDHPRDKATYDIRVTVPKGVEALSNGLVVSRRAAPHRTTTWHWRETRPMATYLAFFVAGQFDVTHRPAAGGLPPLVTAVASNGGAEGRYAAADLARTPEVIRWLSQQWGRYPFDAIGGVAPAADFGFALENQTRPVFTRGFWSQGSNIYVVVHENTHQWYGDSVSVDRWRDIWLNEGFASFSEWLWAEQHDDGTAAQIFGEVYDSHPADDPFWKLQVGNPGKGDEFDGAVYDRGAMTLEALRVKIGDAAFSTVMRTWAREHRYGNGRVGQFEALAEQVSGQQLDAFFDTWLFQRSRPAATAANGFPPSALAAAASLRPSAAAGAAGSSAGSSAAGAAGAASAARLAQTMHQLREVRAAVTGGRE